MAINPQDATDYDAAGIGVLDNDGNTQQLYITTVAADPTGSAAPVNTWVFRSDTQTLYYKFGVDNNDWRQIRADDITYNGGNVRTALDSLQSQIDGSVFGRDFASQIKIADEQTTGGTFVTYDTLNFSVAETATNKFRLNADFFWSHNSASNDIRVRVLLDGSPLGTELRIEPKDPGADQRIQNNLLNYPENLSIGNHTLALQYRPATASRVSRMNRSTLEAWRVA